MPENQNSNFGNIMASALPVVGGIAQGIMQGEANRKARKFAKSMYYTQREHTIEDWNRTNEYNHPRQQMQRLQEAGLNPHLIYGGSGSTEAGGIKTPDAPTWKPESVGEGIPQAIMGIHDLRAKSAQADNLQKQTDLLEEERKLKAAQTIATLMSADVSAVDLDQRKLDLNTNRQLVDTVIELKRQSVDNLRSQTAEAYQRIDISKAMKAPNLAIAMQEIINKKLDAILKGKTGRSIDANTQKTLEETKEIGQKISNMITEGKLKEFELQFKEMRGKTADWPAYMRLFKDVVDAVPDVFTPGGSYKKPFGVKKNP